MIQKAAPAWARLFSFLGRGSEASDADGDRMARRLPAALAEHGADGGGDEGHHKQRKGQNGQELFPGRGGDALPLSQDRQRAEQRHADIQSRDAAQKRDQESGRAVLCGGAQRDRHDREDRQPVAEQRERRALKARPAGPPAAQHPAQIILCVQERDLNAALRPADALLPRLRKARHLLVIEHRAAVKADAHAMCGAPGVKLDVLRQREEAPAAEEVQNMQYFFSGVDFGFAADPACFIRCSYDRKHETIYILNEIYKRGMSNRQLAENIAPIVAGDVKSSGYTSYISGLQFQDHSDIYCDAAEPKSIADLRDCGLKQARACHKEPGCVAYRVKWLQHRRIVVDPARTPNAARELANYEYEKDKDGNMLSSLPDRDNHSIDSLAYALDREIYRKRGQSA